MHWDRASASGGACSFPFPIYTPSAFCCDLLALVDCLYACMHTDWERSAYPDLLLLHCYRQSRVASLVHALLILLLAARCLHLPALAADRAFGWDPRVGKFFAVTSG